MIGGNDPENYGKFPEIAPKKLLWIFSGHPEQRKKCNVLFIYLSKISESSDYSCDFCQHKSRIWTTDTNVNNAMYIL